MRQGVCVFSMRQGVGISWARDCWDCTGWPGRRNVSSQYPRDHGWRHHSRGHHHHLHCCFRCCRWCSRRCCCLVRTPFVTSKPDSQPQKPTRSPQKRGVEKAQVRRPDRLSAPTAPFATARPPRLPPPPDRPTAPTAPTARPPRPPQCPNRPDRLSAPTAPTA